MAISKVIYKSSASAQGETWIDATLATAAAADIMSPKTAMLADGVVTQGTGTGGGSATLITKTITANGTYNASSDNVDGYSSVTASIPNVFTITDTSNTTGTTAVITADTIIIESKSINANGTYTAPSGSAYSPVIVSVPNSYSVSDEGKVVNNGALVAQTAHAEVTSNGTIDTTLNNSVVVNVPASAVDIGTKSITSNGANQDVVGYAAVDVAVPNSYAAEDEGKVVSNGALVAQTAHAEVTQNGTIDTTLNNSVVVNVGDPIIPTPIKDVVFVDYDGEIVQQYTAQEFLALSALPANPSHTGLTAQGWNWTLADAKTYVQSYGCLCIGQNYTTSDGKTRIYLDFTDQNMVGRPLYIILCTTVKGGVTIDWGDGTSTTTTANANASGTCSHTYAAGRYTLTLECTSGTYYLGYNGSNHGIFHVHGTPESDVSATAVIAMEVGDNVTALQRQGFGGARNLRTISIPTTLTDFGATTGNVFAGASSLKCLVFPSGTTAHYGSIASTRFLSVPKSLSALGGLNGALRMLTLPEADWYTGRSWSLPKAERIVIPGTYTTLGGGGSTYRCFTAALYCHKFVVPASVTTIKDYALCDNQGLTEIHFLPTTVPTLENTRALGGAPTNRVIYVPYSEDHSILNAYKTATNWTTFASIMQEEPQ